ncbi:MAG TPA: helix-turn-helix domain-containing protein [Rhodoferax sp.]|jgi:transcriptional regulator with XRE-family HTH domain|nr:helix-turn-helix domain-containing protein [Rhodoferax sp.]HPW28688.1 helix-turn-helix domain-containing protein [Rhodoferax sp.]
MSSVKYRNAVERMLVTGQFSGYDTLAAELGIAEDDLKLQIVEAGGEQLPDLVKFKILALSGIRDLREAIRIVDSDSRIESFGDEFIDSNTGSIKWLEALESLKRSAGFVEDKELASYLGIPSSTLSDFRRNKAEISGRIKLKILDHLGFFSIVSGIEFLLRDEHAAAVKRAKQRQARKIANQNLVDVVSENN